jgi:translation initiation factor IF-3
LFGGSFIKNYYINKKIRAREVRLIDADGSQIGILNITEALSLASQKELDLIQITNQSNPPICKLADYGQFLYQQKKKDKQQKKQSQAQVIKEIKMSHKISSNDYETRLNQAKKFLGKRYKLKLTVTFKGREIVFRDTLGMQRVDQFLNDIVDYGVKDNDVVKSGKNINLLINPK